MSVQKRYLCFDNSYITKLCFCLISSILCILAFVAGSSSHHENGNETDGLRLIPSDHTVVRYTNESLIVLCRNTLADTKVHWKSPKGDIMKEHKGRIHIEASPTSGKN